MKQIEIINAFMNMEQLAENKEFSEMEQWKIYQARKALRSHVEFYNERRNAILAGYQDKANEDGKLIGDDAKQYLKECEELDNLEIDMSEYKKPSIRMVKGISFKIVEQLEDFIEFMPPEDAS